MRSEDADSYVVDQPAGNVALDLFVTDQHRGAVLDGALAPVGLTAILYAVDSQPAQGAPTPGALSERLGIRPTTLSGHLGRCNAPGMPPVSATCATAAPGWSS